MYVEDTEDEADQKPHQSRAPDGYLSEAAILERARDRDVAAFEDLVRGTEEKLSRLAMRYVHNEADVEDILQTAYLSAWRSLPDFEGRARFGSWMHRITVNAALMLLRKRGRHPEVAFDDIEPTQSSTAMSEAIHGLTLRKSVQHRPDHGLQSAELSGHIAAAVGLLPPTLRTTFMLREGNGMSIREAASALGVSSTAVKTRLHRARRVLQKTLLSYVTS
jgi:RNA polymerase sigma-70 factor (ECF subfamily)